MSLGKKKILSQGTSFTPVDGTPYFEPKLYTGNGSTQTITGLNFQPSFVWNKSRSAQFPPYVTDIVRGGGNVLRTSESDAQSSGDGVSSFDSNGFKVSGGGSNQNNGSYVAWAWKSGTSSSTNSTGNRNCTQVVDQTAGFSISTFNVGSSTTDITIGHGLGVKPAMVFMKCTNNNGRAWFIWHQNLSQDSYYLYLQDNYSESELTQAANAWGNRAFDSSVCSTRAGWTFPVNDDVVMYAWAQKDHQKFGSYTGSSSEHSVDIGFAPRFLMIKRKDAAGSWRMYDSARDGSAVPRRVNHNLQANEISIEYDSTSDASGYLHITSTGLLFYTGNTNPDVNANNGTYIYWAQA